VALREPGRSLRVSGVVLAAGFGTRLRPLTDSRPKALLPVGGEPLLDQALRALLPVTERLAVNAHAHAEKVAEHVVDAWPGAYLSVEQPEPLGTAGALGKLRADGWLDGDDVVVHNADAWHRADLQACLLDGWDGERARLLVVDSGVADDDFGPWRYTGVCVLPWGVVEGLEPAPSGLYEAVFGDAYARGELDLVPYDGPWFDCGTITDYAKANAVAASGRP
jgi:MurNAc alpha-1-phosphate uridylyltransferase